MRSRLARPVAVAMAAATCVMLQSGVLAREEVTRSFEKTLTVTGTPTLFVDHRLGELRVRAHARNELRIQATIHVSSDSRSQASVLAERIQIDVRESSGTITVMTRYPDAARDGRRNDGRRDASFSVDYELLVPERLPVSLRNRFGDITVTGMKGGASIANASGRVAAVDGAGRYDIENRFGTVEAMRVAGDVTIRGANGPVTVSGITGAVNISNRFGTVDVRDVGMVTASNASGPVTGSNINGSANITTTFGAVTLRKVARDARVINASGPVKVSDVEGPAYLKTSFGAIEAERVRGELTAENASGSISATGVGGAARVSTSFGPVVLREVDGRVDVTNRSGSVEAWPIVRPGTCHDVLLTTSFSPMVVHLPDTGYAVAARTTFGRIHAEMPITASGTLGSNAVSGTIGRGGCALHLTNASGDIRIARAARER